MWLKTTLDDLKLCNLTLQQLMWLRSDYSPLWGLDFHQPHPNPHILLPTLRLLIVIVSDFIRSRVYYKCLRLNAYQLCWSTVKKLLTHSPLSADVKENASMAHQLHWARAHYLAEPKLLVSPRLCSPNPGVPTIYTPNLHGSTFCYDQTRG